MHLFIPRPPHSTVNGHSPLPHILFGERGEGGQNTTRSFLYDYVLCAPLVSEISPTLPFERTFRHSFISPLIHHPFPTCCLHSHPLVLLPCLYISSVPFRSWFHSSVPLASPPAHMRRTARSPPARNTPKCCPSSCSSFYVTFPAPYPSPKEEVLCASCSLCNFLRSPSTIQVNAAKLTLNLRLSQSPPLLFVSSLSWQTGCRNIRVAYKQCLEEVGTFLLNPPGVTCI